MTIKEDLVAAFEYYADTSGDLYLRVSFGEPGHRIEVDNVVEQTGQAWTPPSFIDGLMEAISTVVSAASSFLALSDTPEDYIGQAGKSVIVNPEETGLIFGEGGGAATFTGLTDTPASYSGSALKYVRVNAGATALEFSSSTTSAHALGGAEHTASTLANLNSKITDATLDTATASRPALAHGLGDAAKHSSTTLANLNALLTDATLDDTAGTRTPTSHALAGSAHSTDTLANLNLKITDATLDDASSTRPPAAHTLGGAAHSADTLANLNLLISDATLDTAGTARPPTSHALAGSEHSSDTLANLNLKITDATLDDVSGNRTDADAFHTLVKGEIAGLPTEKAIPVATDWLLGEDSAALNAKVKIQIGNLPGGSGTDANAIHKTTANEIAALAAEKTNPVGTDWLLGEDSAALNAKVKIQIGNLPGGSGGGDPLVEETFATTGAEDPSDPVSFTLTKTPGGGGSADTPSGYHLLVYRNGNKMGYANPPTIYQEYYYDSVNNEIDILASGSADAYEVLMVEATSSWASYAGHPEDAPPSSPSAYDDEFDGSTLNPSWAWTAAGEPTGAGHSWSIKNSRLTLIGNNDASGSPSTASHTLWKPISLSSDALFVSKVSMAALTNYARAGILVSDNTWDNWYWISMCHWDYNSIEVSYCVGGTPTYNVVISPVNIATDFILGISWNNATSQLRTHMGFDLDNLVACHTYTPGWIPIRAGLFIYHLSSNTVSTIGKFEWFRAVIA